MNQSGEILSADGIENFNGYLKTVFFFRYNEKFIRILLTDICSGVNRSSSDAHDGEANDVWPLFRVFRVDSESLHCSTSTSSSISAYLSTDNGPAFCKKRRDFCMFSYLCTNALDPMIFIMNVLEGRDNFIRKQCNFIIRILKKKKKVIYT